MTLARSSGHPWPAEWRRRGLLRVAACLAAAILTLALLPSAASAAVSNAATNNQKILHFMNQERAARGLKPLSRDPRLDALAQSWADKMAAGRTMYHPGTPQAMASGGYRSGAQNLAWHDTTLSASWAHNFWMNSAPHRKNILDPAFTHTGIAMACNPSGGRYPYVFATVEFGGSSPPLSSSPPASPHVAGGESVAGAGCDGSDDPAPPPPRPAVPPAPADPPPVPSTTGSKLSVKPSAAAAAGTSPSNSARSSGKSSTPGGVTPSRKSTGDGNPTTSGQSSTSIKASPEPTGPPPAASTAAGGSPPSVPPGFEPPSAGARQSELGSVATAGTHGAEDDSGALVALVVGVGGIVLMKRIASGRRRPAPKHSITRR